MKVIVCGGRNYTDRAAVWSYLDAFHAKRGPIDLVIHGGASGADLLAEKWAVANNIKHRAFRPNWQDYGVAAGPIRNRRMLIVGEPDCVIAFPGGKGTADMVFQAKESNVEVFQPTNDKLRR